MSEHKPFEKSGIAPSEAEGKQETKLLHCLDGIFWGLILTVIFINFHFILNSLFSNFIISIYYIPLLILLYNTLKIPSFLYKHSSWNNTCTRLRWSALLTTALLPFWSWWQKVNDNIYLLVNACLLALFASWYVFNLAGLLKIISVSYGLKKLSRLTNFTRLAVIYLTMGPLLAFSIASATTFGSNAGAAIYIYLMHIQLWKKLIIESPVFLAIIILLQIRRKLRIANSE